MAKDGRLRNSGNRPQMDYYEYKRRREERMGSVDARPQNASGYERVREDVQIEETVEPKQKKGGLFGGLKRAVGDFGSRASDEAEEIAADVEDVKETVSQSQGVVASEEVVEALSEPVAEKSASIIRAVQRTVDDVVDINVVDVSEAAKASQQAVAQDIEAEAIGVDDVDDAVDMIDPDIALDDEDELEITNPFADSISKVKAFGGKIAKWSSGLGKKKNKAQTDGSEDEAGDVYASDSAQDLEASQATGAAIASDDEDTSRFARPKTDGETTGKSLSRRERRMAGIASEEEPDEAIDTDQSAAVDIASADDIDEESETIKPRRRFPRFSIPAPLDEDDDDEDDEDDDITPNGGFKLFGRRKKEYDDEVYDEDEYEEEYDEEDYDEGEDDTLYEERAFKSRKQMRSDDGRDEMPDESLTTHLVDVDEEGSSRRRRKQTRVESMEAVDVGEAPGVDLQDQPTLSFTPLRHKNVLQDDQSTRRFQPVRIADVSEEEIADQIDDDIEHDEPEEKPRRFGRKKPKKKTKIEHDEADVSDEAEHEDEIEAEAPRRGFRKKLKNPARPMPETTYDDEDDEEDEDEDDVMPVRRYGRKKAEKRVRVYRDEEYDDYDDDDDYYPHEYDDRAEEDYDEEYDEDFDDAPDGIGRQILRLIKNLLIAALILILITLTLRQLEANGKLSLNVIRSTLGMIIPLDSVFPEPTAQPEPDQIPGSDIEDPADADIEPADLQGQTPLADLASDIPAPMPTAMPGIGVQLDIPELNEPVASFVDEPLDDEDLFDDESYDDEEWE